MPIFVKIGIGVLVWQGVEFWPFPSTCFVAFKTVSHYLASVWIKAAISIRAPAIGRELLWRVPAFPPGKWSTCSSAAVVPRRTCTARRNASRIRRGLVPNSAHQMLSGLSQPQNTQTPTCHRAQSLQICHQKTLPKSPAENPNLSHYILHFSGNYKNVTTTKTKCCRHNYYKNVSTTPNVVSPKITKKMYKNNWID